MTPPRSLIRARDIRARLPNTPATPQSENELTLGRYFEADCLGTDLVGDFVHITGNPVAGFKQVARVDVTSASTMPSVGVISEKSSATRCFVQTLGIFLTSGLTPGIIYWVGATGQLASTPPSAATSTQQVIGYSLSDTDLLLRMDLVPSPTLAHRFEITPAGAVNGANTVFTTPDFFIPTSIRLYRNGQRQTIGSDYLISESGGAGTGFDAITFDSACTPKTQSIIRVDYITQ